MSTALAGLNQIPGVIGSVIFNAQDECVVHMMPPPFEPMLLGRVMAELRNSLNVLSYLDDSSSWSAIVIRYDAGYLVVRQLQKLTVMVLAQPTLNPAMLSVGFNVAALKLEKEGLPPAPLPPPPLPPSRQTAAMPGQMSPMPPAMTGQYAAQPMPLGPPPQPPQHMGMPTGQMPSVSSSMPAMPAPGGAGPHMHSSPGMGLGSSGASSGNVSVSQSGGVPGISAVSQSSPRLASASVSGFRSDSQDTNPAVPDAVGKNIMDALLRALARHIGPFAKLIMKEELTKLGLTPATLGFGQYEDFVSLLSRRVQDPAKRREFITEAEALPHKR
jgi:hypothetical protein